ncbi:NAD(P)H-dependent oxidoreductase [Streptomyces sp. SAI-041]|uniref:NAD(P)H-dependent oxidoreductase n=1 Tax=Streptomyces sp. SAI-041 TaxID=2940548 RepID=UPI002473926F|nr:NAD(P)H-dependent oxidoreductase [Streptomyces sp. SAI-041]MDH6546175.1 FMN reductase [Streptomyces sp. SAI-041]
MSTAVWSPVSLAVVSAGIGHPRPTRRLADWVAEAVCRSLAAGGARAEVEVVELHRLAADLHEHAAQGRAGRDLREALAAVVAADGLVVATPVLAGSPSEVFESFFAVLGDGVLSGMPVLLALNSHSQWRPPDLAQLIRRRLTDVHADPMPTVVVAGPADWRPTARSDAGRLHARIDRAATELAAAMRSHRR